MQNKNKILMRIVAALLCLVLFTTTILSSVYARFVLTDDATVSVGFKHLGVDVEVSYSSAVASAKTTDYDYGHAVSVSLPVLKMGPGDKYEDVLKFSISGKANAALKITLDVDVTCLTSTFTDNYMPIEITCGVAPKNGAKTLSFKMADRTWSPANATTMEENLFYYNSSNNWNKNIKDMSYSNTSTDYYAYKNFSTIGSNIVFTDKDNKSINDFKNKGELH